VIPQYSTRERTDNLTGTKGKALSGTVLVAEDQETARKNICRFLQQEGYRVEEAADGEAAIEAISSMDFDLVLTDLMMPGADGLAVLRHTREVAPNTLVIVTTAYASVESAVEALRLGAQDYILKPIIFEDLSSKVRHLMEYRNLAWEIQMLRRELNRSRDLSNLVGNSRSMKDIFTLIEKVAISDSTVLITGESGVGKEVVAATIHSRSPRKDKVFLPVNCSAIPDTLLESQLFGHIKGAFTGALSSQEGLFQRARGGTIFLDEIAELSSLLQPKLLRAIETKEILPVGAGQPLARYQELGDMCWWPKTHFRGLLLESSPADTRYKPSEITRLPLRAPLLRVHWSIRCTLTDTFGHYGLKLINQLTNKIII
jgi:DNA-binding NtrC family response regulator